MPARTQNHPSPRLVLYGLAFRALRRVALGGDAGRNAASPIADPGRHPRRELCAGERVELERSLAASETGDRCLSTRRLMSNRRARHVE
jgi:hypothetical protein